MTGKMLSFNDSNLRASRSTPSTTIGCTNRHPGQADLQARSTTVLSTFAPVMRLTSIAHFHPRLCVLAWSADHGTSNTNAGIFLSRKVRAEGVNLTTVGNGLYFSAWYRFPTVYTSTRPGENDNLMVMEFMNERDNAASWQVPWSIHLRNSGGSMYFRVDERSFNLRKQLGADSLIHHTGSTFAIPTNKWVHLEVFYKYGYYTGSEQITGGTRGKSDGGQVIVFQDGIEIYRFDDVATTTEVDDSDWVSDRWMVTAYAAADGAANPTPDPQTSPANFQVLVDDAAISTVRLGAPRELIRNGDFANTAHWRLDDTRDGNSFSTASTTGMSASNQSAAKIDSRTGPNNPDPVLYQPIAGGLLPGVPYTLRFTAKSNTSRTMQVAIKHNGYAAYAGIEGGDLDVWTSYWNSSSCGTISLDSSPKNFVCPISLTQGVTNANAILGFGVGGISSTVWIDNVSLVQGENLVRNGDFSDTSAPWTFNLNGATASSSIDNNGGLSANDAKAIAITLTTPLADVWKPELYQTVQGGLDSGITYTVRFSAKASANSRTVWLVLQENEGSYDIIGDCATYTLTTDVQNFICTTTVSKQTNNAVLNFLLGGDAGNTGKTIWIDNVSLSRSQ